MSAMVHTVVPSENILVAETDAPSLTGTLSTMPFIGLVTMVVLMVPERFEAPLVTTSYWASAAASFSLAVFS